MSDLKPVKQITDQTWMRAPETHDVMSALNDPGRKQALFVGGCVRNALLDEPVGDIDIATVWTPDQVTQRLVEAGIKAVPTGVEHGTVTAVVDQKSFEITTLRKDVETDGRRATVAFTHDWREDAERRDFTMNTLLADEAGNIYDPTGRGLADLEARKVIFVGDPATRIAEDHLRILRFFRFHAYYGEGEMDTDGLTACKKAAKKIDTLSAERVTQEFFKILSVDNPVNTLTKMFENNVLKNFAFKEYQPVFLRWFCDFQNRYGLRFLASRLYVLAGLQEKNMSALQKKLLIPKVFLKDIEAISKVLELGDLADDDAVKLAIYKFGRIPTAQALMIELTQDRVINGYAPKALDIIQSWEIPDFPLSGNDLKKAGYEPGPNMGKKLEELENWWISEKFQPDRAQCLQKIKTD